MCKKILAVGFALVLAVCPLLACGSCSVSRGINGGFLPRLPDDTVMEFKEVSESEFMRSFRPRLMVARGAESVNGKNILDDTRYTPTYPTTDFPFDSYDDLWKLLQHEVDSGLFNPDLVRSKKLEPSNLVTEVTKQRVKDMVYNANHHNSGGASRPIKETYCFVAKRKLIYPNSADYEVDYLYCWYDKNHTNNGTFEGVSLGDFYLQPNTIALMRFNSNGYSTVAYMSADEVGLSQINSGDTAFAWYMGKNKYSVINSDGTVESLDYSNLPSYYRDPCTTYFHSGSDVNSITEDVLVQYYNDNTSSYSNVFGDVLTNVQAMFTNGLNDTSYLSSGYYHSDWFISASGFFPANGTISDYINDHFSTETNINPKYAPTYNNFTYNNYLNTGSKITTENVTNYNDYGVTYNNATGEFELDVDTLTAKIEADITPKFDLAFKGVYENQPAIDGDFTVNDNNYIDITDKYITDIVDKYYPAPSWVAPTFPAVETAPLVSYTYPVLPTETVPQSVLDDVGTVAKMGFDAFDTLGTSVIAILVSLAVLGAVSYYIWG